ncbi:hypothetical protein ZWY2020_059495 [Hordeum vulgare]|nr:hypothetical protein ZWY2020_059495 [Hordeum vulgare]
MLTATWVLSTKMLLLVVIVLLKWYVEIDAEKRLHCWRHHLMWPLAPTCFQHVLPCDCLVVFHLALAGEHVYMLGPQKPSAYSCILLGAIPFPSDVPRLKQLGVQGVVTLNEPYETLVPMSLYQAHGIDHLVIATRDYLFAPSLEDICQAIDFIHRR